MQKWLSFSQIKEMRRWTETYMEFLFPYSKDIGIRIRVLTQDEILMAHIYAKKKAKSLLPEWEVASPDILVDLATRYLLQKAVIVSDEEKTSFFSNIEEVWELSKDEALMLVEQYNEVQEKYAPATEIKTSEDFDNLIEEIKKKSLLGMSLNSYTLRELVAYMTVRITKLQKDNGTISSPSKPKKEKSKKNWWTKKKRAVLKLERKQ